MSGRCARGAVRVVSPLLVLLFLGRCGGDERVEGGDGGYVSSWVYSSDFLVNMFAG